MSDSSITPATVLIVDDNPKNIQVLGTILMDAKYRVAVANQGSAALNLLPKVKPDLIQLDSYGAQGASGSPILDKSGLVIGVLYGGQPGSNGRILYGVPVSFVRDLLAP